MIAALRWNGNRRADWLWPRPASPRDHAWAGRASASGSHADVIDTTSRLVEVTGEALFGDAPTVIGKLQSVTRSVTKGNLLNDDLAGLGVTQTGDRSAGCLRGADSMKGRSVRNEMKDRSSGAVTHRVGFDGGGDLQATRPACGHRLHRASGGRAEPLRRWRLPPLRDLVDGGRGDLSEIPSGGVPFDRRRPEDPGGHDAGCRGRQAQARPVGARSVTRPSDPSDQGIDVP